MPFFPNRSVTITCMLGQVSKILTFSMLTADFLTPNTSATYLQSSVFASPSRGGAAI